MQSTDVSAAISIMERYGLIFKEPTSGKHHSLSSVATVSLTKVSKPVPVKQHPLTAFEARAELLGLGWQPVESALECSIEKQRMMKFQCGGYFRLLMHYRNCLLELASHQCFSHAQKHMYYEVIETLCIMEPFETRFIVYIF